MIQSPALIPNAAPALPGESAAVSNGDVAQGADFGALLAISVALPAAAVVPAELSPASPLAALPAATSAANPASNGKNLPLALPPQAAESDSGADPVPPPLALPAAQPALKTLAAPRAKAVPTKEPSALPKAARKEHKAPDLAADDPAPPIEPDPAAAPLTAPPATTVTLVLAQSDHTAALPAPPSNTAQPEQPATTVAAPVLVLLSTTEPQAAVRPLPDRPDQPAPAPQPQAPAAFVHAAPPAAFLRAPAALGEQQPNPDQSAAPTSTPPLVRPLRIEIAVPEQVTARINTARPVASRLLAPIEPDSITTAVFAATSPAPQTPLQLAAPAVPFDRPQDFTALLDRLVAAREAAAPQRVSVTLPHAEFGPVHLRFRQEDGTLAVTMTSADPEFARIASQAAPPVMPAADSRPAAGSANHSDNSAAASNTGSGQPRGQSTDRRSEQATRDNPAPRAAGQDKPARRPGIFA